MDAIIEFLIYLFAWIWHADDEVRAQSRLGDSDFDRRWRRRFAQIVLTAMFGLILFGILWAIFA